MLNSATLLGSSSGRNAGDAALIAAIIRTTDEALGRTVRYEIPTIRPEYIRRHYPAHARPVGMLPWNASVKMLGWPTWASMCRTDISLIFDAILFDRALFNPLFNFMSTLRLMLPAAKRKGRKMAFFNVGTGPVSTPRGRRMLKEISELMDFITVRDRASFDILKEIGVAHPRLVIAADAALNAPSCDDRRVDEIFRAKNLDPAAEYLAININHYLDSWAGTGREPIGRERFLDTFARALDTAGGELGVPLLFITTQHADVGITRALMARVKRASCAGLITNVEFDHEEIKGVLRRVGMLFGMRLHAMILASSERTPIVGLAYQPKIHHYYARIGLPERSLGFERFSEEDLARHMLDGWRDRASLRAHLGGVMPGLQREAWLPARLLAALDRGEDLDPVIREHAARP